ncbi:hypothetical protein ACXGSE_06355 [Enterococcus hirae]
MAYFIEFQKTITHENRNKDVYTLLLKDTNLYLVDHKSKVAIKVAANVNFEDGKIKSDNKILLSNLSPNENMKWPISSYKASKIYEIAKINQSRNIPQLSNNVVELQKRSKGKSQAQRELLNQNQKMDTRSCVSIGERPGTSR